ncbi:MAG: sugar ABC transporter substrate-binding protein [Flexilinea sp.]
MNASKRLVFISLSVLIVIAFIAGFANIQPTTAQVASTSAPTAPTRKKVGVIIWATDDGLSSSVKRLLDYAGEALNIELVYKTGDYDTESQVKAAENLVAAGVDGIIAVPLIDSGIPKIYKVCEDAKIPYIQAFRRIDDKTNAAQMDTAPFFLGYTVENEEQAGYDLLKILADAGSTTVGTIYNSPGSSFADRRKVGIEKAISEGVAKKVVEFTLPLSPTSDAWVEATNNFINAYPELNGIIMTAGSVGGAEASIATIIKNNAVGKVKMVTFDQPANSNDAFDQGILVGLASGTYTDPLYSFVIMANYLQGTPLSNKPIYIASNYLYIKSKQDALDYSKYVDGVGIYPYTKEEIQQMTKFYNPSFTADDLQKIATNWTMANVLAKAKK